MNFQRDGKPPHSAGDALTVEVDDAPDYYAGELEAMRARVRKLTELLAAVLDTLPPEAQAKVLERAGNGWEPVK